MVTRDVAATARCASCHGSLDAHEERFDAVEQCVVCHGAGSTDPVSGNSLDLRVMVHKIHRGESLPSVVRGGTYALADRDGGVHDYSTVVYPQPVARCDSCHGGASSAAWNTNPTRAACVSCHDDVSFEVTTPPNMVAHSTGPAADDSQCAGCHLPTTGTAPILPLHLDPTLDHSTDLGLAIQPIASAVPGNPLTIQFRVTVNGAPRDIVTSPLALLRAYVAGPNSDFTQTWLVGSQTTAYLQATIQGTSVLPGGTLTAIDAANGLFQYTFPVAMAIPPTATGSYTVGLEGRLSATVPSYTAVSVTRPFAVTDPVAVPRRAIVDQAKCENCHFEVTHHGASRGIATCVLCHNPATVDDRVSRYESSTIRAESIDFRVLIHRIHTGPSATSPYLLGTFPPTTANPDGAMRDFASMRLPRSSAACESCHLPGTYRLPASTGRAPTVARELTCTEAPATDADSFCQSPNWVQSAVFTTPPETAACTSCHDSPYAAAHATLNTTSGGVEACTTCHGPSRAFDVDLVHPR